MADLLTSVLFTLGTQYAALCCLNQLVNKYVALTWFLSFFGSVSYFQPCFRLKMHLKILIANVTGDNYSGCNITKVC